MRLHALILAVVALLPACVPLDDSNTGTATTVAVGDFFFSPMTDSLVANENNVVHVTFTWLQPPSSGHRLVCDSTTGTKDVQTLGCPIGTDLMLEGQYTVDLGAGSDGPATYWYHCALHASDDDNNPYTPLVGMTGAITVSPYSTTPSSRLLNRIQ